MPSIQGRDSLVMFGTLLWWSGSKILQMRGFDFHLGNFSAETDKNSAGITTQYAKAVVNLV